MASNVDVALLVAGLDNDFNLRRIERYLAVAWSSAITPVVVLNKADLADDVDGRLVAVDAIARASRRSPSPARTGQGLDDLLAHPSGPGRRRPSSARRASASRRSSTRCSARTARRPPRSATRTRAAATRRPIASCSSCPGGALLVDTPGIRALEVLGADEGVEAAFDDVADLAAGCRFSDCRHEGEPGCAVRAALADGTAQRGAPGQPSEAGTRAGPSRPRGRPTRPGRAPPDLADHPEVRRRAHGTASTEETRDDDADAPSLGGPGRMPGIPGLRTRFFSDDSDYDRLSGLMASNQPRRDPMAADRPEPPGRDGQPDGADPVDDMVCVEAGRRRGRRRAGRP